MEWSRELDKRGCVGMLFVCIMSSRMSLEAVKNRLITVQPNVTE